MGKEEVDEKALLGLRGVLRTSRTVLNGPCFLNLDGFAPAADWDEHSRLATSNQEATHDL